VTTSAARLFGVTTIFFATLALLWHDADTWQELSKIWNLPFGTAIGQCLMVAQLLGGVGLLFLRTRRVGSIALLVVYALSSLVCIHGILTAPTIFAQYDSFFEQFCLFCGALAVYVAAEPNAAQSATLGRMATIGLGLSVVSFTLAQVFYFRDTAGLVPKWIPPSQTFWAILTTIAFGLASIAILINIRARLAIRMMVLMLVAFGALVWIPLLAAHPSSHFSWSEFAITLQIAGAAWAVGALKSF